jgi:N-acyl homoserine lactone hydrolase
MSNRAYTSDTAASVLLKALACAVLLALLAHVTTIAQRPAAAVSKLRVYVFDNGSLPLGDTTRFGVPREELTAEEIAGDRIAVGSYLIVHPKGTLMWDTGVTPDAQITPGVPDQRTRASKTLASQMAEIGHPASSVTFFALSHYHSDHTANAGDFAGATWLVRKVERDAMFADPPPRITVPAHYAALKNSKTTIIDGDYDVFGDGTVVIKPTPGHTEGHQVLYLKLAATGPVVLSGDLYHLPEERRLKVVPTFEWNKDITPKSRETLEAFMTKVGATLWIQHDFVANSKLKKSPAFYE